MHPIREQLIKTGNLLADISADGRLGKTARKRAKRYKAAAEARAAKAPTSSSTTKPAKVCKSKKPR